MTGVKSMIRTIVKSIILGGNLVLSNIAQAEIVTYNDLPRLVRTKNRLVQASTANAAAMEVRSSYLSQSFLPKISATTGTQLLETKSLTSHPIQAYRIESYVNVYNGGRDELEEKIRDTIYQAATIEISRDLTQQLLVARQIYWRILSIQELIDLQQQALVRNIQHIKAAKQRISAGVATRSDLLQFELQGTALNQDLKRTMLDLDIAKNQLTISIGVNDHSDMQIKGSLSHPPHLELRDSQIDPANLPEIVALKKRKNALELEAEKFNTAWAPQLDVYSDFGQPTYIDRDGRVGSERVEWFLGLRIKLDLSDSVTDKKDANAKRLLAQAAELRADNQAQQVQALQHELLHELPLQHDLLHDAETTSVQAEQLMKLTMDEYNRGVKNGTELLAAAQQLLAVKKRSIEQRRDYYITRSELLSLLGD